MPFFLAAPIVGAFTSVNHIVGSLAILLAIATLCLAQNPTPRTKSTDYPVHGALPGMEIGIEYLVHSIPGDNQYYFAKDYLVLEVALFPSTRNGVAIYDSQFTLRVNGKNVLYAVSPGAVAASIKYPDWTGQRGVSVAAGNDNAAVVLGRATPYFAVPR